MSKNSIARKTNQRSILVAVLLVLPALLVVVLGLRSRRAR